MSLKSEKGIVLLATFMLIVVVLIYLTAFVTQSIYDRKLLERDKYATEANYIAQAGLERAFYDLDQDFRNDADGLNQWIDGNINNNSVDPPPATEATLYSNQTLGNGLYTVLLEYVFEDGSARSDRIWARSTASITDTDTQITLRHLVKAKIVKNITKVKLYDTVGLAEGEASTGEEVRMAKGTAQEKVNLTLDENLTIRGSYDYDFSTPLSSIESNIDVGSNTLIIPTGTTVTMGGITIK